MPTKPTPQFTAWSYSRLKDWERCGLYAKLKYLDKLPEPQGPAMGRGNEVHKVAEAYVTAAKPPKGFPPELENFKKEFSGLRKDIASKKALNFSAEGEWAFTSRWTSTGWFDRDAWLRVKVDAAWTDSKSVELTVVDHKTGKRYPDHPDQLHLYGTVGFVMFPAVARVRAKLWYLDLGEEDEREYERGDLKRMIKTWEDRSRPLLADKLFAPRPNDKCKWCHYRKGNRGPCQY